MTRAAFRPEPVLLPAPTPADRLHALARRVERLATAGRFDPEAILVEKLSIASAMRRIAAEVRS